MFLFVFRKIINNKWLILCLLIGSILLVGMVSAIPMYTNGILSRMLTKDLETFYVERNIHPGIYEFVNELYYSNVEDREGFYNAFDRIIDEQLVEPLDLTVLSQSTNLQFKFLKAYAKVDDTGEKDIFVTINATENIEDRINIINGKMFSSEIVDDYYEVMVTQEAMYSLRLVMDKVYTVASITNDELDTIDVKIVGVFSAEDSTDPFWQNANANSDNSLLLNFDLAKDQFVHNTILEVTNIKWLYVLDYTEIDIFNLNHINSRIEYNNEWIWKYRVSLTGALKSENVLLNYYERQNKLNTILWILIVPVLLMLGFYMFMVSKIIIDSEVNEISILKSRGGSRGQIFNSYVLESLYLCVIAIILGPLLGYFLCSILGSANGFLEFINRSSLDLKIDMQVYAYSIIALILFVGTILIPAASSTRTTIVEYKQAKYRKVKSPLWKKIYIDFALIGISFYMLSRYNKGNPIGEEMIAQGTSLSIDPLLFFMSTFFMLGAGLLFLRVYPYILKAIFFIGKRFWSPEMYATFIQVGRSKGTELFIMLFIIFALSVGLFSANAARTLNQNVEDKIYYNNGADIVIQPHWETESDSGVGILEGITASESGEKGIYEDGFYVEPNIYPYVDLDGIESWTKVYIDKETTLKIKDKGVNKAYLMAIDTYSYGNTVWFRDDLLGDYHINSYLNLLGSQTNACLVSTNFATDFGAELGDEVSVSFGSQGPLTCYIFGFVDYFPSYNPMISGNEYRDNEYLIVTNYSYVNNAIKMKPHPILIKKEEGVLDSYINNQIVLKELGLDYIDFTDNEISIQKSDPLLQGINGALTLGFVVTMVVTAIGFIIYWLITIKGRVLQYGIFRAMGMSKVKLISLLVWEQILTSGIAVIAGVWIGTMASNKFVPMFHMMFDEQDQVPPFHIITLNSDYLKVYIVIGFILLLCLSIIGRFVYKIKIDQAVKLGED